MKKLNKRPYTLSEEIFSALTHGIGVGLGVAMLVVLVVVAVNQGGTGKIVSSAIYGTSIILLYLASTLYHSIPYQKAKRFFKTLDHSSIYLLIAGSYTPFSLVTLKGAWGWSFFGITWGLAALGLVFKIFFVYRFRTLSIIIYIVMGWLAIIAIKPICANLPTGGIIWLAIGGISYTFGTIFYGMHKIKFMHGIWHLFVLAGTICQFFSVLYYVIL